jgi:AbrB family looped-hinge helix DNA binding protein
MNTVTLSTKYQLVIPRDVRDRLALEPGAKFTVIEKGGILCLVPEEPLASHLPIADRSIDVSFSSSTIRCAAPVFDCRSTGRWASGLTMTRTSKSLASCQNGIHG